MNAPVISIQSTWNIVAIIWLHIVHACDEVFPSPQLKDIFSLVSYLSPFHYSVVTTSSPASTILWLTFKFNLRWPSVAHWAAPPGIVRSKNHEKAVMEENKHITRPSALGMSDPIWGPLIHIFVDEKKNEKDKVFRPSKLWVYCPIILEFWVLGLWRKRWTEKDPSGWSFARGLSILLIIYKRSFYPADHLQ